MEYYSAIKRDEIGSFVEMWMDIENVIQSQKEKIKYSIVMHICGIQKNNIDDIIRKAEIETQTENKCMDTKGKSEGAELGDWIDTYTTDTMHKTDH